MEPHRADARPHRVMAGVHLHVIQVVLHLVVAAVAMVAVIQVAAVNNTAKFAASLISVVATLGARQSFCCGSPVIVLQYHWLAARTQARCLFCLSVVQTT